jgi:hypothetical protein
MKSEMTPRVGESVTSKTKSPAAGVLRLLLAPTGPDRFDAHNPAAPGRAWATTFQKDPKGNVESLTLDGVVFRREQPAK